MTACCLTSELPEMKHVSHVANQPTCRVKHVSGCTKCITPLRSGVSNMSQCPNMYLGSSWLYAAEMMMSPSSLA